MTERSETQELEVGELYAAKVAGVLAYQRGGDYLSERALGDGRAVWLMAMLGGNLRIAVGRLGDCGYDDGWCFHDHDAAWRAALGWNGHGDPEGWYRHLRSGRRRPDGTEASEYVMP